MNTNGEIAQIAGLTPARDSINGETLVDWDAYLQEFARVLEMNEALAIREAEEAKLDREIREHMDQIDAAFDWLAKRTWPDLEADEALIRLFDRFRKVDVLMRERCRDFPAKLTKWEEQVMLPVRLFESFLERDKEEEKSEPAN